MSASAWLRTTLFGLGEKDLAACRVHWHDAPSPLRERLDAIVDSFARGYNLALASSGVAELVAGLEQHDPERKGFAYEGAGMGLAIRIMVTPGSRLLDEYLRGPGDAHHYMIQVGAGWALGRVPIRHAALRRQLDDTYHWLAWDGFGFHQLFFDTVRTRDEHAGRPADAPYQGRAFDQGVGRRVVHEIHFEDRHSLDRLAREKVGLVTQPDRRMPEAAASIATACGLSAT